MSLNRETTLDNLNDTADGRKRSVGETDIKLDDWRDGDKRVCLENGRTGYEKYARLADESLDRNTLEKLEPYSEHNKSLTGGVVAREVQRPSFGRYYAQSSLEAMNKIFIGGLSWETTEETIREYFSQYGEIIDSVVMRDRHTGQPRGFGFVTFSTEPPAHKASEKRHDIDGRQVEAKLAVPRGEKQSGNGNVDATRTGQSSGYTTPQVPLSGYTPQSYTPVTFPQNVTSAYTPQSYPSTYIPQSFTPGTELYKKSESEPNTRKIFVGGLALSCTSDDLVSFFKSYGPVDHAQVMVDHKTGNSRGFGFVTFSSATGIDQVMAGSTQSIKVDFSGRMVEVKRAEPRGQSRPSRDYQAPMYSKGYTPYSNTGVSPLNPTTSLPAPTNNMTQMLAAQYASYYGGTPSTWENYAQAAMVKAQTPPFFNQGEIHGHPDSRGYYPTSYQQPASRYGDGLGRQPEYAPSQAYSQNRSEYIPRGLEYANSRDATSSEMYSPTQPSSKSESLKDPVAHTTHAYGSIDPRAAKQSFH